MDDSQDLTRAWNEAQERLPVGWSLEGLRCASTSLSVEDRSDDWVAVATGPSREERSHRSDGPVSALEGLVASFGRA